jgi:cytochrome c-type biogenesis protein CcmE
VLGAAALAGAAWLALGAFSDSLVFYVSPSQVAVGDVPAGRTFRIGGLVEKGSLRRGADGLTTHFAITDTRHRVEVVYDEALPDLFREGHGTVAQGTLRPDGLFAADLVLAKHDERYMPVEAAQALEDARRLAHDGDSREP